MKIGKELNYLLNSQKREDAKQRIRKVYEALLYKRGNNPNWFDCPSAYLIKVSPRYNKVVKLLLDHKIIEFQSFNYDQSDIFNQRRKKYYNTEKGICMRYRFLIDTEDGDEYEFNVPQNLYDDEKWYMRTRYSLLQLNFSPNELLIKRDNFSRRLHTNITGSINGSMSYRDLLSGGEYFAIDAKTSQPRLLWMVLNEIGLVDKNLNYIFENGLDFYDYIIERIDALKTRDEAKELFTSWINGTGYIDLNKVAIRDIFSVTNMFIRNYKTKSYKDVCKLLQNREANIFIDDLLNNSPVDFTLSVHDSLIVKKEDVDIVLEYCRKRQPNLIFECEEIKRKK
ncbi:MAG: hypothetical protein EBR27_13965 [Betaproteobacteria bacterium]|nr:hypothetical protein [Betaproteobacteria bacterium]